MIDETLTAPCEGIWVWEGARVIYAPARGYQGSLRRPGDAGIVVAAEQRDSAVWASAAFGVDVEAHPPACLLLDLTHRQTRLEVMARLAERVLADDGRREAAHGVTWRGNGYRQWLLQPWCCSGVVFEARMGWNDYGCSAQVTIPALADVDPTDDTRLPDGARVVDVRALAIVLRHVFSTKVESQCRP